MAVPGEVHVLTQCAVTAAAEAMDVTLKDKQREAVVSMVHERIGRFRVFSH